jgi:hypothetical protein
MRKEYASLHYERFSLANPFVIAFLSVIARHEAIPTNRLLQSFFLRNDVYLLLRFYSSLRTPFVIANAVKQSHHYKKQIASSLRFCNDVCDWLSHSFFAMTSCLQHSVFFLPLNLSYLMIWH